MMQAEQVFVAVTLADGQVAVLGVFTVQRGPNLPQGATWIDPEIGWWRRNPTDAILAIECPRVYPTAISWRRLSDAEAATHHAASSPDARRFRDALTDTGTALVHDMPKARELCRRHIREKRDKELDRLDDEWMRAMGQNNRPEADAIEAERQVWRDAPADPRIDAALTVDELKALVV